MAANVFEQPHSPAEIEVMGGVFGPLAGAAFPARFKMHGVAWVPALNRLDVFAESDEADAGRFVVRVLDLLRHTPVQAVGSNFVLESDDVARFELLTRPSTPDLISKVGYKVLGFESSIKVSYEDDAALTITFDSEGPGSIRFNFHRQVKDAEGGVVAASKWRADYDATLSLYNRMRDVVNANGAR